MALTVSPQIRVLALVGLLLAVGFGGAMRVMGGGDSATETAIVPARNAAVAHTKDVAAKAGARARATAKAATPAAKAKAAPATTRSAPAKVAAKPARGAERKAPVAAAGLSQALSAALAANPTVVAVVFNPQANVDAIAFAEARAGAALAGAGFVGLSVLSRADVAKLTEELGVLPDPAVLVFTRPATLSARIDGFADKETVAQAAQNAARGS